MVSCPQDKESGLADNARYFFEGLHVLQAGKGAASLSVATGA
jgi:hypothetical protein